jgi:DNA-directed RNA polymerase subunit M/transcription elongation factor TFIIS
MKNKKFLIFCEVCSYKKIFEEEKIIDNLIEIKISPIQGGLPQIDSKTGKTKNKPKKDQNKKYKCPKCGRGVMAKEIQGAYLKTIKELQLKEELKKIKEDHEKRINDGKPLDRFEKENN